MAEAKPLLIPKFGQTVEEAKIVKWHKKEGDKIAKGEIVFEIETDKAVLESESFIDGTLLKIVVKEGSTAPVQTPAAFIGDKGDTIPKVTAPPPSAPKADAPSATAASITKGSTAATPSAPSPVSATPAPAPVASAPRRLTASPRAKKLAKDKVISLDGITGSGPNGRILENDVKAYLDAHNYKSIRITPTAKNLAKKEKLNILSIAGTGVNGKIGLEDVKNAVLEKPQAMNKMRQIIAQRLTQSFTTTPHFYVAVEVDMTDLLAYRAALKASGAKYSVTDFIMQAVILSLKEHDVVNSSTDGLNVSWHSKVQLGLAVSVKNGLVVPVIRNAEDLSMEELHDAAADLAKKAREGKLTPDEMQGGTFTISNMGMLNVHDFNAIINPGEAAILAVSSTMQKPVVMNGEVKVRSIMNIRASVDHRIVDGATGAEFVNAIKSKLEDIELWKRLT
jgi:pyruvate dehydrogenase E2 component (dihydrolipoamide acetyltransferase)